MICSSENRFFTSNLRRLGDWTPNRCATQNRGDVAGRPLPSLHLNKISCGTASAPFQTKPLCSNFEPRIVE